MTASPTAWSRRSRRRRSMTGCAGCIYRLSLATTFASLPRVLQLRHRSRLLRRQRGRRHVQGVDRRQGAWHSHAGPIRSPSPRRRRSLRPALAIGGLAGLRPAELHRLTWDDVHLDEGHIEVSAKKSKTASRPLGADQRQPAGVADVRAEPQRDGLANERAASHPRRTRSGRNRDVAVRRLAS